MVSGVVAWNYQPGSVFIGMATTCSESSRKDSVEELDRCTTTAHHRAD